ncbi:neck protein [Salmonella phage SHWT1]|uniref:Neck protein n=1 Tax=Salmonella phage SHWT1 TaxID=2759195 RepID=A0A7G8AKL3_9CAUD|nr:neck protein [Salmonella phage SHWT1]QNI20458.1 neck protein [Salmonella phage SHWT1]
MVKTKSEIFALIGANFPDNQSGLITPEKLREVTTQIADSMLYGVKEVEVLRAASTDIQAPTTTGTALTVSFGGVQKTSADPVMINASGVVTFNAAGNYAIRVKLQAGRTGASGTSILLSRVLLGGAQFCSPAAAKLASADATNPIESRVVVNAVAGQNFAVEIMRDAAGSNFGGLYPQTATVTSWGVAPSALLVISRLEAA